MMEMMTRTQPQSQIWRAYTAFMLIVVGVYHAKLIFSQVSTLGLISSIVILVGLIALTGWAFGFQFGTKATRWAIAVAFSLTTAWAVFQVVLQLVSGRSSIGGWASTAASYTALFVYIPMCIALFRYGGDWGGKLTIQAEVTSTMPSSRIEKLNRHHDHQIANVASHRND